DYQRTINEDATQRAQHHGGQQLEPTAEPPEPPEFEEELLNLNSNHVYKTVPIPEGVTPITSKPIFHIKHNHTGNVECYKVHIVTWGFTQKEGIDYQEVFAPIANLDSVQTVKMWSPPGCPELSEAERTSASTYVLCPCLSSVQYL
ncbi:hypothetical protein PAXRUDRAFT_172013, partial [Paxillus rubicundulus Ve08.2h10]